MLDEHHMEISWRKDPATGARGDREGGRVRPGGGQALLALDSRPKQLFGQSYHTGKFLELIWAACCLVACGRDLRRVGILLADFLSKISTYSG